MILEEEATQDSQDEAWKSGRSDLIILLGRAISRAIRSASRGRNSEFVNAPTPTASDGLVERGIRQLL